jgi:LysM repeat protein
MFKRLAVNIFILILAVFPLQAQNVSKEYIDSLKTALNSMNMPQSFIFLPHALSELGMAGREGIWSLSSIDAIRGAHKLGITVATPSDTAATAADIRNDITMSTRIALQRLSELFNEYEDWNKTVIAYALGPSELAHLDSAQIADAQILVNLKEDETRFSGNPQASFEDIERQLSLRKAEREVAQRLEAERSKARVDSLRKIQAQNNERVVYRIKRGDTLGGIAARYHVTVSNLKRWNNLHSDLIREGRTLIIYRN